MQRFLGAATGAAVLLSAASAWAQCDGTTDCTGSCPTVTLQTDNAAFQSRAGHVSIAGATLFSDFFDSVTQFNDFVDVDGDGNATGSSIPIDRLASTTCGGYTNAWLVSYRSVGSVRGLGDFVDCQAGVGFPQIAPSNESYQNGLQYHPANECGTVCNPLARYIYCVPEINLAVLDVPTSWAVRASSAAGTHWDNTPTLSGYGHNPLGSWDTSYPQILESLDRSSQGGGTLNTNTETPDDNTVYDTPIAWAPIGIISNRGADKPVLRATELQHLFVTGRLPGGQNLVGTTRDIGSGTRNGAMNSLCIDPSFGRGDNLGDRVETSAVTGFIGPNTAYNNAGGSSRMEDIVRNVRLAVGYTGALGGSRIQADVPNGFYEATDVVFDDRGGTQPVRLSAASIINNGDPDSGWQIGGPETFTSRGDPFEDDPGKPEYMEAQAAAWYLRNVVESINNFEEQLGAAENDFMPGRFLAENFSLLAAVDAVPDPLVPCNFVQQTPDPVLQNFTLNLLSSAFALDGYGTVTPAGLVPNRDPDSAPYSDGSTNGNYLGADRVSHTVPGSADLNVRNAITGDFNNDGARNINDTEALMTALFDPDAFVHSEGLLAGDPGDLGSNFVIPEIIGDFNSDGNFDAEDARYWADGLAVSTDTKKLDRKEGFTRVDTAWLALNCTTRDDNYFNTTIATGAPYKAGSSRADIAGNTPAPGAKPLGHDGAVDAQDIDYVCRNFGEWADLDQAVNIDLSADMNGDCVINQSDVDEIVFDVLCTEYGDVDLDGDVDNDDLTIAQANSGSAGGWADGDVNCDGRVDAPDTAIITANQGFSSPCLQCPSEPGINCIGDIAPGRGNCIVNNEDLGVLLASYLAACGDASYNPAADLNQDGVVNNEDLGILLASYLNNCN